MRARGLRVRDQDKKQSEGPHGGETQRGEAAQMRARGLRVRDQVKTRLAAPHEVETPRREHRNGAGSVVSAVRGSGLREVAAARALHPSVPDPNLPPHVRVEICLQQSKNCQQPARRTNAKQIRASPPPTRPMRRGNLLHWVSLGYQCWPGSAASIAWNCNGNTRHACAPVPRVALWQPRSLRY